MAKTGKLFVLDTSALICLMEAEPGAERVRDVLAKEQVILPFVSLLELRYMTVREHGLDEADMRYALLKRTNAKMIWELDEATLFIAARFKANYRLSLGDTIIAAITVHQQATLIHKDPELSALRNHIDMETLPFKK